MELRRLPAINATCIRTKSLFSPCCPVYLPNHSPASNRRRFQQASDSVGVQDAGFGFRKVPVPPVPLFPLCFSGPASFWAWSSAYSCGKPFLFRRLPWNRCLRVRPAFPCSFPSQSSRERHPELFPLQKLWMLGKTSLLTEPHNEIPSRKAVANSDSSSDFQSAPSSSESRIPLSEKTPEAFSRGPSSVGPSRTSVAHWWWTGTAEPLRQSAKIPSSSRLIRPILLPAVEKDIFPS